MSLLVLGATSLIAQKATEHFVVEGHDLYLSGRRPEELERLAAHYRAMADIEVQTGTLDAAAFATHADFAARILAAMPELDHVLLAFGALPEAGAEHDPALARRVIDINLTGAISVLTPIVDHFERRGRGSLILIGSVAGDRGRKQNYLYGAAKAGLHAYAQGLRQRLYPAGVHVLTVKPGFVDTPMTAGREFPAPLVGDAERVGADIYHACRRRREVLYSPGVWRWIMAAIRAVPERLFKRTNV